MIVMANDTQAITKDNVTTDVQVLFVDDIVAKNYDNANKVENTVVYDDTIDLAQFGANVKAFIESLN